MTFSGADTLQIDQIKKDPYFSLLSSQTIKAVSLIINPVGALIVFRSSV
jgi:hypothetical protein